MKSLEILAKNTLTTKEVKLLFRRANSGEGAEFIEMVWDNAKQITDPQQGINWLINLMKTPNGREHKNNPFGYREMNVVNNIEGINLIGSYNAGNKYFDFFVPLYEVEGGDDAFQYYFANGKINIVG